MDRETSPPTSVSSYSEKAHRTDTPPSLTSSKASAIQQACNAADIKTLVALAFSEGGLLTDELRQLAWPILLGCASPDLTPGAESEWKSLATHPEEEQVRLDVDRSFVNYPKDETKRAALKPQLSDLIVSVLRTHPSLGYFQGYHDITGVLLLVLGPKVATEAVSRLSLLRIRDFMGSNLDGAITHLQLIPYILQAADRELAQHLQLLSQPFYALSATLTLYAHEIEEYGVIARLFDFLIAGEAVTSVYLFCEIIRMRRAQLLEIEPHDSDMLYFALSKLPKPLDFEVLISSTLALMKKHPPESLGRHLAWFYVPTTSVLKTTRDPVKVATQTLEQGEAWLAQHEREMKRRNKWKARFKYTKTLAWKYRSPALLSLAAVAVGVLSVWLGRNGGIESIYAELFAVGGAAGTRSVLGSALVRVYRSLGGVLKD